MMLSDPGTQLLRRNSMPEFSAELDLEKEEYETMPKEQREDEVLL